MNIFTHFFRLLAKLFGNGNSAPQYDREEYHGHFTNNDYLKSNTSMSSHGNYTYHSNSRYRRAEDDHYGDDGEFERYEHGYEGYDDYFEDDY